MHLDEKITTDLSHCMCLTWNTVYLYYINLKSDMHLKITGLHSVYLDISTQFRDGVEWFFVKLHEKKVPVLIISAGLGGICRLYPCLC